MHPHDAGNGRRAHDTAPARALVLGVARLHEGPQAERRGGDLLSLKDVPVDRDRDRHDHGEPVLAAVPHGYGGIRPRWCDDVDAAVGVAVPAVLLVPAGEDSTVGAAELTHQARMLKLASAVREELTPCRVVNLGFGAWLSYSGQHKASLVEGLDRWPGCTRTKDFDKSRRVHGGFRHVRGMP